MITERDLDELEQLATAATGDWQMGSSASRTHEEAEQWLLDSVCRSTPPDMYGIFAGGASDARVIALTGNGSASEANMRYLFAAQPQNMLRLVAEIRGLQARLPRPRTRDLRIRLQYTCWRIQFWMMTHRPHVVPSILHMPIARIWRRLIGRGPVKPPAWLNWIWTAGLPGWYSIERFFRRHTGGRSHRCEFTDRQHGALYGHNEGAFMNAYFDKLLENIGDVE